MIEARITGLPDLRRALADVVPKLRKRALRNALAAGARIVRDAARRAAPVLTAANAMQAPHRTPRTLQKAIVVRTSKAARRRGDVGVFVNVRPAKAGQRGAKSRTDPFYWRWLEFGWTPARAGDGGRKARRSRAKAPRKIPGRKFLQNAAGQLQRALAVFTDKIGPAIARLNKGQTP